MKRINFLLVSGLVAILVGIAVWRYAQHTRSTTDTTRQVKTVLRIGTNAEFPPFAFMRDGEITGFDSELIKIVAQRLGLTPEFKNMDFDVLLPQLQAGAIDVIASGMTETPARAEQVLFTKPYLGGVPLVIVSRASHATKAPASVADLNGQTVIVNDGFTADTYLSQYPAIKLKRLATVSDAFLALNSQQADAYVGAENSMTPFLEQYGRANYQVRPLAGTNENCAIAVSKLYPELLTKIQTVLDQLAADGTIDQLKTHWKLQT